MIITITGKAGSGKSTLAKSLAQKLGYKYYSIGELQRKFAESKNITLEELRKIELSDPSIDKDFDKYQTNLGKKEDHFVMDSRYGAFFLKKIAFKIFVDCDDDERFKRIITDKEQSSLRKAEARKITKDEVINRDNEDRKRSKEIYGFDYFDKSMYDLIIDSTNMSKEKVLEFALAKINKQDNPKKRITKKE